MFKDRKKSKLIKTKHLDNNIKYNKSKRGFMSNS